MPTPPPGAPRARATARRCRGSPPRGRRATECPRRHRPRCRLPCRAAMRSGRRRARRCTRRHLLASAAGSPPPQCPSAPRGAGTRGKRAAASRALSAGWHRGISARPSESSSARGSPRVRLARIDLGWARDLGNEAPRAVGSFRRRRAHRVGECGAGGAPRRRPRRQWRDRRPARQTIDLRTAAGQDEHEKHPAPS